MVPTWRATYPTKAELTFRIQYRWQLHLMPYEAESVPRRLANREGMPSSATAVATGLGWQQYASPACVALLILASRTLVRRHSLFCLIGDA